MRNLAVILALVLACGTLFGQDIKKQQDPPEIDHSRINRYQKGSVMILSHPMFSSKYMYDLSKSAGKLTRSEKNIMRYGSSSSGNSNLYPRPMKKGKLYLLAHNDENNCIFTHLNGMYIGGYRQEEGKPTFIREGIGMDKIKIRGVVQYKYYIGFYKKNKRHGYGFSVDPKGKMYAGEWKHGRLLVKTKRSLTPEEEEKIVDYVKKMNDL